MEPTALDDATLAVWRAEAAADRNPFVDPALFRAAQMILAAVDREWLCRVAGRPVRWWGDLNQQELTVAVRAAHADRDHLAALTVRRAETAWAAARETMAVINSAAQADRDEWAALAARLPVPVAICHNWTARHLDGYEQGADHIVVLEDLHVGRIHRRAHQPLCWTPSRARELRHVHGNAGDEKRTPDCKACLRTAENLATRSDRGHS